MRLLYCIPSLENCGGTERVLTTRLNYLAEHTSYSLYVVTTERQLSPPYFKLNPEVSVINLDINFEEDNTLGAKLLNYKRRLRLYKEKLSELIRELKPDIVTSMLSHEIDFLSNLEDGSAKIGENHFNRNFRYEFVKNNSKNILRRTIAKCRDFVLGYNVSKLDALVTLTQEDADAWPDVVKKLVIPNPLSFTQKQKSRGGSKQIVAAGRLTREKGFDMLLDAWRLIFKFYPDWSLMIYGEGDEREGLQSFIQSQGIENVCIHPFVPNISDKFVESDFYVLSSRFEGFGLVIIEAMECGLPVVAFDCQSGPGEIITDGKDGILVKSGDVVALADAMRCLMDDGRLRSAMGLSAIEKANRYSIDNIMSKWINLYKTISC